MRHLKLFSFSMSLVMSVTIAVGQEGENSPAGATPLLIDTPAFEVPNGELDELIEFVDELSETQAALNQQYRAAQAKLNKAMAEASAKILSSDGEISDEHFVIAARLGLPPQIQNVANADVQEQTELLEMTKRQLSIMMENQRERPNASNALRLATYLERYGDPQLALKANEDFAEMLEGATDRTLRSYQSRFASSARRLALLGKELDLEGELVDGSELEWEKYRGKVVLVDFWATWCGPCVREAPNVRKNYELYHDKGFEVLGISLDRDREALEAYLEKESVPWENIFKEGAGWNHPMAKKYGVSSIPAVWMIDKEGKVVSMNARGKELGAQLKELLGPVESAEDE